MRVEEIRTELCLRLRERLPEIEQATLTRARAVCDPRETADPEYTEGFRRTISAALGYGIDALECGEERVSPIPLRCFPRPASLPATGLASTLSYAVISPAT
jgi:hypothetical protein